MARNKEIVTSPRLLAMDLERQLIPGSFVHALRRQVERDLDLSAFDAGYANDQAGAAAYPPGGTAEGGVRYAQSLGIVGSRGIARTKPCRWSRTRRPRQRSGSPGWAARLPTAGLARGPSRRPSQCPAAFGPTPCQELFAAKKA